MHAAPPEATVVGLSGGIATPVAIIAGVLAATFGGSHDNPADMPDKYDTARYTQYVGELQGVADTAYAAPYTPGTDPVQVALGGLAMLKSIQGRSRMLTHQMKRFVKKRRRC
jgi:hypothetical protein